MQIVRTAIWVLLLVALLLFSVFNWNPVEVRIWEGIVLETKIPAIVIVSFLIGFLPTWLYHRGTMWRAHRKIANLETAARTAAATPVVAHPTPADRDADGVPDRLEPGAAAPATARVGDRDGDRDGDGVPDRLEPAATAPATARVGDRDSDGVPDRLERDPPASTLPPRDL